MYVVTYYIFFIQIDDNGRIIITGVMRIIQNFPGAAYDIPGSATGASKY